MEALYSLCSILYVIVMLVIVLLAIVLSVSLWLTDSGYPFSILIFFAYNSWAYLNFLMTNHIGNIVS